MILAIPHSSTTIPYEYIDKFLDIEIPYLDSHINHMTDLYTDDLFRGASRVVCPVSRLICDVERYNSDKEPMLAKGMGISYTRSWNNNIIKRELTDKEYCEVLTKYYYPYHNRLAYLTDLELKKKAHALIVDCHSFFPIALPYEKDFIHGDAARPDFCLGTNENTPDYLTETAYNYFTKLGFKVDFNFPYEGTIVPTGYEGINSNVYSIMLEVNRDLYCQDIVNGKYGKGKFYNHIQCVIDGFLEKIDNLIL